MERIRQIKRAALGTIFLCLAFGQAEAQTVGGSCSNGGWLALINNQLLYCSGSSWGLAEQITNSGLVGIGTTSPNALLDIGSAGGTLGTMRLEGSTSGYVQLQTAVPAGSWTMTLPTGGGASGYVLSTNGSGVTSWVSNGGAAATINLGTSAATTNPQRSGQGTTGLFSATSNVVSIAENSTDVADFASTGINLPGATFSYKINGNNALWQDTNYNLAVGMTGMPTTLSQTGGGSNGQSNVAVGYGALNADTTGQFNVAVGFNALNVNTTGYNNVAIGATALLNNTTGNNNTALGMQALESNVSGISNVAVGQASLLNNTSGNYNMAIGSSTLQSNTTGTSNIAIGNTAQSANTSGVDNVAIGTNALNQNTTGTNNTVLGHKVASTILNGGTYNILIGTSSAVDTTAAGTNYNLNIGNLLQGDMTNSTSTYNKTLYLQSTASGVDYLQIAGGAAGSPGAVTISGQGSDTNISIMLTSKGTGNVATSGQFKVGSFAAASATTVCSNSNVLSTCSSSIRYKEKVKPLKLGLNELMRMRPVTFKWKGRDERDIGFIAEDMHEIDPILDTYVDGRIEGVKYGQLTAVIVNAVKEQQAAIENLTAQNKLLKRELGDL